MLIRVYHCDGPGEGSAQRAALSGNILENIPEGDALPVAAARERGGPEAVVPYVHGNYR